MKFLLSHEQLTIQESVQQTVTKILGGRGLHEVIDGKREKEVTLWQELCALGVPSLVVPEDQGGQGLGLLEAALISEVLGYTAAPGVFLAHTLATLCIDLGGDLQQRTHWLPQLASGKVTAAVAFAEPGDRWLPQLWTMTGESSVSGTKTHVVCGEDTTLLVVGLAGGELGLVDVNRPGVERERLAGVDRTRTLFRIRFENAPVTPLPHGRVAAPRVFDAGLTLLAADSFGVGRRCVEMAVEYAKQREQFGVKLAQFQALRHQLANMALEVEPCRGLYWYAAHSWDKQDSRASHAAALAKAHIVDRCLQVARDNIEAHGGIGFTWEYDAHIWLKRAIFNWQWLGGAPLHRARAADLAGW